MNIIISCLLQNVDVRFIEYMPFDGNKWNTDKLVSYSQMLKLISEKCGDLQKLSDHPHDTSKVGNG